MARHLARAEADLVAVVDGASLCRIGSGPQAIPAKHAEGRYAALRELAHLRRSPDAVALASAIRVLDSWETAQRAAEPQGDAWVAYRDGGVTELRSLVDDLTNPTGGL